MRNRAKAPNPFLHKRGLSLLLSLALLCIPALAQSKPRTKPRAASKPAQTESRDAKAAEIEISREVYQAEQALDKEDFAAAEKLLKQALAANPRDGRASLDLGLVYKATGRDAEAEQAFRAAVAANPKSFEANLNLGLTLGATKPQEAATFLKAATQVAPAGDRTSLAMAWSALAAALARTDRASAIDAYKQWIALQPDSVVAHASLARAAEASDPALAETHYKRALEINPKLDHALAGLVNLYATQKRFPDAEAALRRYVQVQPENVRGRMNLARVLAAQGKTEEARAEYAAVLKLEPGHGEASAALAESALEAGDYAQAEQQFSAAVAKEPSGANYHRLARALIGQKKYAEAEGALRQALHKNTNDPAIYGDLAFAASSNKNYPLALQALDARAQFAPETPETLFLRATVLDHLQQKKMAAEAYRKFLEVAGGKHPDQEWQARHRLKAIDPEKK